MEGLGLSQRRACEAIMLARSSYYYHPEESQDGELRNRLRELAQKRPRFGYRRLHILLRREGYHVNHKWTERVYHEEGLALRRKRRRKLAGGLRVPLMVSQKPNQRWSMDFVSDSLACGRKIRVLTVVDDYTRECPAMEVDTSLGGLRVTRLLDRLAQTRGLPEVLRTDNGPEFAGKALDEWAYRKGVRLDFIQPGKPVENAYVESFNGKLRDECLNGHWFMTLQEARKIIEDWRRDYNESRPHSSLGNLTPEEFAGQQTEMVQIQNQQGSRPQSGT